MEAKKNFVINALFYLFVAAAVLLGYKYILPAMSPFIIGFLVASLLRVPMKRMKLSKPAYEKWVSALFCLIFYTLIVWLLVLLGVKLVGQVRAFIEALPDLFNDHVMPIFWEVAGRLTIMLKPIDPELLDWLLDLGKNAVARLGEFATSLSAGAAKVVVNGAVSIPGVLVEVIVTVVSSFYIAADYPRVLEFLKNLIPQKHRGFVFGTLRYAETAVLAFLKSYSIMFVITLFELCVGLNVLKIPHANVIALAIAIFDLMPILGTGGILLPWAAVSLIMGDFFLAAGVLILYLVIAAVRHAVEPRIVGNHIGLPPLATLVAMFLGLSLGGMMGMLCLPIMLVAITHMKRNPSDAEES